LTTIDHGPNAKIAASAALITLILSSIFIAWKFLVCLCWTSITLPNEPMPSVLMRSKSFIDAVFYAPNTIANGYLYPVYTMKQTSSKNTKHT